MKKINFSDKYGLTEAVLSGRKTQTRRICKEQYWSFSDIINANENQSFIFEQPKYKIGEVVAVAQSYKVAGVADYPTLIDDVYYETRNLPGWANKLFTKASLLPHRIRITNVRVERLQDISDEDCIKEGVGISATDNRIGYPFSIPFKYYVGEDKKGCRYSTPREAYAALINKISGKRTWDSNPWVFVYDFELVK